MVDGEYLRWRGQEFELIMIILKCWSQYLMCPKTKVCYLPYSGKLSREKTFTNFAVLWLYAKVFFGAWHRLTRRNWEWRLFRLTAVFKGTIQGKNWTACEKGQTLRILTLWLRYVDALLLAMSPEICQPLVRYSWDEGGPSDMINFE